MLGAESSKQEVRVGRSQLDTSEGDISMNVLGTLMGRFDDISCTDINGAKESDGKMGRRDREWQQVSINRAMLSTY